MTATDPGDERLASNTLYPLPLETITPKGNCPMNCPRGTIRDTYAIRRLQPLKPRSEDLDLKSPDPKARYIFPGGETLTGSNDRPRSEHPIEITPARQALKK